MKKILILALAGIGDGLLLTPTIALLRTTYPDAKISTLVRDKPTQTIFERNKAIDEVLHFPFMQAGYLKSLQYVFHLRKQKYDVSILAFPANRFQHNLIAFLIGAKLRLAHLYELKHLTSLSFLNNKRLPLNHNRHTMEENLHLLNYLGISSTNAPKDIVLPLSKKEENEAKESLHSLGFKKNDFVVGIHAGSSELAGMANKRWPREKFVNLARKLVKDKGAKILLFGGPNELQYNQSLQQHIGKHAVLADTQLSLLTSLTLVKHCKLFVTNDSLFMHIAAHHKVPTVVLSGHLNPRKYKPLLGNVKYLTPVKSCNLYRVGEDLTCKYKGTPKYCLNQIGVEQAYRAVQEVLK